jgi:uncharacterized membrane protein YphA (DoxX/SURF4 family)
VNPAVYALGLEAPLQRLFSSFPDGRLGLGLLLLRVAVGAVAIVLGITCITSAAHRGLSVWLVGTVLTASGAALVVGFVTVMTSVLLGLCVMGITLSLIPAPPLGSLGAPMIGILVGIVALGIALIGPGAFSVDGYLFGRREIVIPPRPPES